MKGLRLIRFLGDHLVASLSVAKSRGGETLDQEGPGRTQIIPAHHAHCGTSAVSSHRGLTYTGIVRCGHCGCNLVGELKKGTYVYYHCTGNKGNCAKPHCAKPYTRQERLHTEITSVLRPLIVPAAIITWLRATLAMDDDAQETARAETLRQAQQERDRLQKRLEAMYLDKLDGRITNDFYDQKATEWRQEQNALTARINDLRTPSTGYQAAVDAIQAISDLCESYENLPSPAKRALLHAIIKTANWQNGEFRATLKSPIAQLAHSNQGSTRKQKGSGPSGGQTKNWLPGIPVSNRFLCG